MKNRKIRMREKKKERMKNYGKKEREKQLMMKVIIKGWNRRREEEGRGKEKI